MSANSETRDKETTMSEHHPDLDELLARLGTDEDDALLDPRETDIASIDRKLEDIGIDPANLAARGEQLVARLANGELGWQQRAREKISAHQELLERAPRAVRGRSRAWMIARIDELRSLPGSEQQVEAFFRSKSPDEMSDEELAGMIEDLELLNELN